MATDPKLPLVTFQAQYLANHQGSVVPGPSPLLNPPRPGSPRPLLWWLPLAPSRQQLVRSCEQVRHCSSRGQGLGATPSSPHWEASPLPLPGLAHTHCLLWPFLGSLGVHLQGGKPGGPLLPVEDRISETFLSSPASPPADLTLGLGHWYKHSPLTGRGNVGQQPGGLQGLDIPCLFLLPSPAQGSGLRTKLMHIPFLLAPRCFPTSHETRGTPGSSFLRFPRGAVTRPRSQRDSEESGLLPPGLRPAPANWSSG